MNDAATERKRGPWVWLLWWQIDPAELDRQVSQYHALSFYQSMRGISVLCLALSALVTATLAFFRLANVDSTAYLDTATMVVLAVFIFLGHRWAMIGAMIVWTAEKIITLFDTLQLPEPSAALMASQLIWWAVYMHAFYFAFRVEQRLRASSGGATS